MLILQCSQGCYGRTDGRTDGRKEGRTDGSVTIPSQLRWRGNNQVRLDSLAFLHDLS